MLYTYYYIIIILVVVVVVVVVVKKQKKNQEEKTMTICNLADQTITTTEKELKNRIRTINKKIGECHDNDNTGMYEYDRELMRKLRDELIHVVNNINTLKLKEIIREEE